MGRKAKIRIIESEVDLKKLLSKYKEERLRKRIRMLMHLKSNTYKTRIELANAIGVGKRTLERWIHTYENKGINALLAPIVRRKSSTFITKEIYSALLQRLSDPKKSFVSYVEMQAWLREEFDCNIKYENLYYYVRVKFKTKLKVPRKSHIKKDEKAVAFFKNATVKI